jgi:hypothetical protein
MNKLLSLVGTIKGEHWRLKEVFILAILLMVAVTSTDSAARASIHGSKNISVVGIGKKGQSRGEGSL